MAVENMGYFVVLDKKRKIFKIFKFFLLFLIKLYYNAI